MLKYLKWAREMKKSIMNINYYYLPMAAHMQLQKLYEQPHFNERGRLLKSGFKVYSQNEEDGIIQEIFNRIGLKHKYFVEMGVGNGLENNTLFLLLQGWKGLWIEGGPKNSKFIKDKFGFIIKNNTLLFDDSFINRENINGILKHNKVPYEVDLLSVDLDGNEYHIFKQIDVISARVVVIEYNAKFPPPVLWVMKYNPNHLWDSTDYMGASLKSLENLFNGKNYSLVGCNVTGSNAFFVRNDLLGENFLQPFTAENHYEPSRYWLTPGMVSGSSPNFGEYESI
jgi:hypothetical protein